MIRLYLIRHGKTPGNLAGRYVGRTDEPLDEEEKARLVRPDAYHPEILFCSPLRRCRETAEILFPECGKVLIPEFAEIDFGAFEYRTYKELSGDPAYQAWIDSGGTAPFPGGDSMASYRKTVLAGMRKMCGVLSERSAGKNLSAAAVVHGGTIMALLSELGVPKKDYFDWHVQNGCGYDVHFDTPPAVKNPDELLPAVYVDGKVIAVR